MRTSEKGDSDVMVTARLYQPGWETSHTALWLPLPSWLHNAKGVPACPLQRSNNFGGIESLQSALAEWSLQQNLTSAGADPSPALELVFLAPGDIKWGFL